jgi:hypothetical protein
MDAPYHAAGEFPVRVEAETSTCGLETWTDCAPETSTCGLETSTCGLEISTCGLETSTRVGLETWT